MSRASLILGVPVQVQSLMKRALKMLAHPTNRWHWISMATRAARFRVAVRNRVPVDLPFAFGTSMRCWPDSHIARSIAYSAGLYDFNEMTFIASYLRPGDRVLDVGANIGAYSVLAGALTSPDGVIDAIEPVGRVAERLRTNLALNGLASRVRVHEVAVGATAGWVNMTTADDAVNNVIPDGLAGGTRVPVMTLDEIASQGDGPIVFGKLDIEGMEWNALRGAVNLLARRQPPIWMVEINGSLFRYGLEVEPFLNWMRMQGFVPAKYVARERALRFDARCWDDVFFVALDSIDRIRARIPGLRTVGLSGLDF